MKTSTATSIALGEPIGASILAYFLLRQEITILKIAIMAIVLFSIFLTISQEIKESSLSDKC